MYSCLLSQLRHIKDSKADESTSTDTGNEHRCSQTGSRQISCSIIRNCIFGFKRPPGVSALQSFEHDAMTTRNMVQLTTFYPSVCLRFYNLSMQLEAEF